MKVTIPEDFKLLTLGQLMDIQKADNSMIDEVSILSHVPKDELYNILQIGDLKQLQPALEALTSQILTDYDAETLPAAILVGISADTKVKVQISKDLGIQPAGAFIAADLAMQNDIDAAREQYGDNWKEYYKPSVDAVLTVLANFLYCDATGLPWTEKGAEAFKTTVRWLPAFQALPISNAFFLPYLNYAQDTISYWNKALTIARKQQELKNLRRSAG